MGPPVPSPAASRCDKARQACSEYVENLFWPTTQSHELGRAAVDPDVVDQGGREGAGRKISSGTYEERHRVVRVQLACHWSSVVT